MKVLLTTLNAKYIHTNLAIRLLFDLNRASGTTMVLVTHDLDFAARCDRVLHLHEGRLREDPANHRRHADAVPAEPGLA